MEGLFRNARAPQTRHADPWLVDLRPGLPFGAGFVLAAAPKVPAIRPQVQGVFPHGAQRGTQVEVSIKGKDLHNTREIRFVSPKLKAEILHVRPQSRSRPLASGSFDRARKARFPSHRSAWLNHRLV